MALSRPPMMPASETAVSASATTPQAGVNV